MATDSAGTPEARPPIRRVLVCVGSTGIDRPALQVAAGLAAGLRATLAGLYVEDEQLQRVAALPFTQEFSLHSAQTRGFSVEDLRRGQRQQAVQLRRLLAALAEPLSLPWTIDVVRGDLQAIVQQAASASDLLVLARPQYTPAIGGPDLRELHPQRLSRHTIAVLDDASPPAGRALMAAMALKRATGSALVVLVAAPDSESFASRCTGIRQQLGGLPARLQPVPDGDPIAAAKAARDCGATALILPGAFAAPATSMAAAMTGRSACLQVFIA